MQKILHFFRILVVYFSVHSGNKKAEPHLDSAVQRIFSFLTKS